MDYYYNWLGLCKRLIDETYPHLCRTLKCHDEKPRTTSRCLNKSRSRTGSSVHRFSTSTNSTRDIAAAAKRPGISGCDQGTFSPPNSRGSNSSSMNIANSEDPKKSILASFPDVLSCSSLPKLFLELRPAKLLGTVLQQRKIATASMGNLTAK